MEGWDDCFGRTLRMLRLEARIDPATPVADVTSRWTGAILGRSPIGERWKTIVPQPTDGPGCNLGEQVAAANFPIWSGGHVGSRKNFPILAIDVPLPLVRPQ